MKPPEVTSRGAVITASAITTAFLILILSDFVSAGSYRRFPEADSKSSQINSQTVPIPKQELFVIQSNKDTIESYDKSTGDLTIHTEEYFNLPLEFTEWTFAPAPSEVRLEGGTFGWDGLGSCIWIPERDHVECLGIISSFWADYRYRYQPTTEQGRFTYSANTVWSNATADITWMYRLCERGSIERASQDLQGQALRGHSLSSRTPNNPCRSQSLQR